MNPKEIGTFLKQLRNEKGITQEQLAEILGVSGRTVSRWETGSNLPDLSILVQISEYYDVEIKEILNGERESGQMDHELKETLLKVADYHELERQKAERIGNLSFGIMFFICAASIAVQIIASGNLSLVIGETVILIAGGLTYIFSMVKNGAWNGTSIKSTPKTDFIISILCAGIFSAIFFFVLKEKMTVLRSAGMAICFFAVFSTASYALLRGLSFLSRRKSDKEKSR